mmetsp:Transcript_29418/g.101724  ORF Transcript_29418/g.101724 Transcript_29418/m.101724 type:complete len:239 (-) Transcript_29418:8-724(-)
MPGTSCWKWNPPSRCSTAEASHAAVAASRPLASSALVASARDANGSSAAAAASASMTPSTPVCTARLAPGTESTKSVCRGASRPLAARCAAYARATLPPNEWPTTNAAPASALVAQGVDGVGACAPTAARSVAATSSAQASTVCGAPATREAPWHRKSTRSTLTPGTDWTSFFAGAIQLRPVPRMPCSTTPTRARAKSAEPPKAPLLTHLCASTDMEAGTSFRGRAPCAEWPCDARAL